MSYNITIEEVQNGIAIDTANGQGINVTVEEVVNDIVVTPPVVNQLTVSNTNYPIEINYNGILIEAGGIADNGLPTGGTVGQFLRKSSSTDYDAGWVNITDVNTTYGISAETATGGANLRLTGSDATIDNVKFADGSNVTITRTDANTITFTSTDTKYGISAETATGGVNLRLTGTDATTDDVKLAAGSNITLTRTDANTITIAGTGVTDIVQDLTPQLGGNLDVNGKEIVSVSNGNITLAPNGSGDIILKHTDVFNGLGMVLVGPGTDLGIISANGANGLLIQADPNNAAGSANVLLGVNGSIDITSGPTGKIYNKSNTTLFGVGNATARISSYSNRNLEIVTNDGVNSGSIILNQGVNGNMLLDVNGNGVIVINNSGTNINISRRSASTGTQSNALGVQRNFTANTLSNMNDHMAAVAFSMRDSAGTQSFFTRVGGVYRTNNAHQLAFELSTDNFTNSKRFATLAEGALLLGHSTGTEEQNISTVTAQNLVLSTNQATNSGTITITNGANGNISITPNGTGSVVLDGLSYPQTDGTAGQVLKTNGSGVLSWVDKQDPTIVNDSQPAVQSTGQHWYRPMTGALYTARNSAWEPINDDGFF